MKFDNPHEEHAHTLVQDTTGGDGEVQAPTGWFGVAHLTETPEDEAAAKHFGGAYVLVRENNDGIVTFTAYETPTEADHVRQMLGNAYGLWLADVEDAQAKEAVDGYRQAAVFTATDEAGDSLDGKGIPFSEEAQRQMRDDVIDFIVGNADDCREFIEVTGMSWLQIGIDFWLTRNGHGAGFWDRGAGAVGQRLTDASKPYGSSDLHVSDAGEFEVE